jgi:hypothetical protein
MDFVGVYQTNRKGHDYVFMVVDKFNNMCILMPCKNTIKGEEVGKMFIEQFYVKFRIPRIIILDKDTHFPSSFWTILWENMDTKFNKSTPFHPEKVQLDKHK